MIAAIKRRDFISLLGGAAAAWPLAARAQQPAMPVVGYLSSGTAVVFADVAAAFADSLGKAGFVSGKTVTIDYRWTDLARQADVIVASGGAVTALAAKAATSTVPIVFIIGDDPVQYGLVASLGRPGANITGISLLIAQLEAKRLELLTELVPKATTFSLLVNPNNPNSVALVRNAQSAARTLGKNLQIVEAKTIDEIDAAFASAAQNHAGGLIVGTDIFFTNRREQLIRLAAVHSLPMIHQWRESVTGGGLVSYGISHTEPYRQAASYTARILKGERPTDLPVLQPTKFELVINLKTAKALGLEVPPTLLARADEVIE